MKSAELNLVSVSNGLCFLRECLYSFTFNIDGYSWISLCCLGVWKDTAKNLSITSELANVGLIHSQGPSEPCCFHRYSVDEDRCENEKSKAESTRHEVGV